MSKAHNWRLHKEPWMPPDYDDQVVFAVRALYEGLASDGQQKLVWTWLMYVTGAGDEWANLSFRPGPEGERDTVFAEGKRFAGLQLRKMLHPAVTPKTAEERQGKSPRHRNKRIA